MTRYRFCDDAAQKERERKVQRSVRLSAQPVFVLREMRQHLSTQRIVAPAYKSLQDMVGRVISGEGDRIHEMLGRALNPESSL